MHSDNLSRFALGITLAILLMIVVSGFVMPHTFFANTISGGSKDGAKEALSMLKDSTVWMAGIQTATIAALGFLAKEGVPSLKLSDRQVKLAVLVLLLNSFALFFSAWILTSLPSLTLRVYAQSAQDFDFFNLPLYSFMRPYPILAGFSVHLFAFWNHWLWGLGIIAFGALSVTMVLPRR